LPSFFDQTPVSNSIPSFHHSALAIHLSDFGRRWEAAASP
jgi:hypothetical protein